MKSNMKLFVWQNSAYFLICVLAESVKEARLQLVPEIGRPGEDDSGPEWEQMRNIVWGENPEVFTDPVAHWYFDHYSFKIARAKRT